MITCLNTSKERFDGERIKNTLIYDSLKKYADLDVINLSKNKIINTVRIFFKSMFGKHKYENIIISKDSHGANIIQRILKFAGFPSNKIVYFEIGPFLYDRILNGTIKKKTFIDDKLIIVETPSMKEELASLGFSKVFVVPNFKPVCRIPFYEQDYPKNTLKLVFLSRIEEQKGIYDLIDCLKELNEKQVRFSIDVFGRPQNAREEEKIKYFADKLSFVKYKGPIEVGSEESYIMLSSYDLHVFPTKYKEGFPGTIIDFFIAGVPTLSSTFARAHEILDETNSILFKQGDNSELKNKLLYVYENQNTLSLMRENTFLKKEQYSVEHFEEQLQILINRNFFVD